MDAKYTMSLSLGVIDHLGLNLYSNIPAVLSELVANAWDADAKIVRIDIHTDTQEIVIVDDGCGMTERDINAKFLKIGYRRREHEPTRTPIHGRHVMGRKGIGKLSIFSIADEVEVQSAVSGGEGTSAPAGFVMRSSDIRIAVRDEDGQYHPEPLDAKRVGVANGTQLRLSSLRKKANSATAKALRKRLARRFSIIGPEHDFKVLINAEEVGVDDRDYFKRLEYLWSVGEIGREYVDRSPNVKQASTIDGVIDETKGYRVSGWVGTAKSHGSLEEGDNSIVVLAWGKLIHEDILKDIKAGGLYTKYLIGELRADFLDTDTEPDIVTSDRQSLREDDARFDRFREWVRDEVLREIGNKWRDWRRDQAMSEALENQAVKAWHQGLTPASQKYAKTLFGKIGGFPLEREEDRKELYRHTILAFERLRFRDALREIEDLGEDVDMGSLRALFATVDDLEAAEYHRIAQGRLEVISRFEGHLDADAKERVIQEHLFDHLWLLDPSWERATTNERMEKTVKGIFEKVSESLTEEERKARVDIAFRTAANKHVVIELKRYSAGVGLYKLAEQLEKYRSALNKCIQDNFPGEEKPIEIIAVLGSPPTGGDSTLIHETLDALGARFVTYDNLILQSQRSYEEYLDAHQKISEIAKLLESL